MQWHDAYSAEQMIKAMSFDAHSLFYGLNSGD